MTIYEIIGGRIKEARNKKSLKGYQLGEQLGVDKQTVSNWETGKTKVPADTLNEISKICEVSISWLVTGEEEKINYLNESAGHSEVRETGPVDLSIIKQVIEAVMEHLQNNQLTMPPEKVSELVAVLYEEITESQDKQINKGKVARLIKLAS